MSRTCRFLRVAEVLDVLFDAEESASYAPPNANFFLPVIARRRLSRIYLRRAINRGFK